ncbi:MAG TPA: ABC transporter permease [Aquihabitans sp.]|jgi:phospholipid/cholesterol/gamma-HCH transport system permease protein|nr:ABC transporter permease [Aquihabitans sp.]
MAMVVPGISKVGNVVREIGSMAAVGIESVRRIFSRPWPVAEFLDQCWFIAKVTTVPVILISIPFGMVISLQVGALIRQLGADAHLGSALVLAVVREQAPIATALLIAGAGGSAMCADIGSRKIRDELAAMEVMSINPIQRVVMPRVVAATLIAVLLDAVVSAAGLAGGWFFAVQVLGVSSSSFFASFNELSQLPDLWMALVKAGVFGFIAGVVACYKGLSCKGGPKGVGDAVNQAVVITFILLFFVNFVLTAVYFNFVPQKV